MKLALSLIILVVLVPVLDVYAQTIGSDSPFERSFQDVKFTNAYFGTIGNKIEVEPVVEDYFIKGSLTHELIEQYLLGATKSQALELCLSNWLEVHCKVPATEDFQEKW